MHLIHTLLLTSVYWLLAILWRSSSEWGKKMFIQIHYWRCIWKVSPVYCWCISFFLMGRRKFFFFHSTQASTFPLYSFQSVFLCACLCACRFPAGTLSPPPCALSLYHHIFPWQINFTHDQPTLLAVLGPAVIKRREITIYIILMQTSFSR